jgi:O-antigen/teichoic acid export membrane protein
MLDASQPIASPKPSSLKRRVLNAGAWAFVGYGVILTVRFGSNLLMTRLLAPEMFGIMSIASIVLVALAMFSDLGLKQFIVQSQRGHDPELLNTAWAVQIVQGVLLWLGALGISLVIWFAGQIEALPEESAYANPVLPYVIAALSLGVLIAGLGSTKLHEASRKLTLGRIAQIEILSQVASLVFLLVWVSIDRSIWALVAGALFGTVARTVLSHVWMPGTTNRWTWDKAAIREILHFGKWMFLSSILGFLVNNGDRLLLGGMIDSTMLGVYVIAHLLFSVIDQVLATLASEVAFPALGEMVRERQPEANTSYYRMHALLAAVAYFCAGLLMISGQAIIDILYDPRYSQAGWMLQVLAAVLLTIPARFATQYFLALGLPHLLSTIIGIRLITLLVSVVIGFHLFGLPGAIAGVVLSHFSCVPAIVFFSMRNKLFNFRRELAVLPVIGLGMMAGVLINLLARHLG